MAPRVDIRDARSRRDRLGVPAPAGGQPKKGSCPSTPTLPDSRSTTSAPSALAANTAGLRTRAASRGDGGRGPTERRKARCPTRSRADENASQSPRQERTRSESGSSPVSSPRRSTEQPDWPRSPPRARAPSPTSPDRRPSRAERMPSRGARRRKPPRPELPRRRKGRRRGSTGEPIAHQKGAARNFREDPPSRGSLGTVNRSDPSGGNRSGRENHRDRSQLIRGEVKGGFTRSGNEERDPGRRPRKGTPRGFEKNEESAVESRRGAPEPAGRELPRRICDDGP